MLFLMATTSITSRIKRFDPPRTDVPKLTLKELFGNLKESVWALLFPVLLIVGIRFGIFTASESGAFAVVYAIIVGKFIYKELTWEKFRDALITTVKDNGAIMLIIAMSGPFRLAKYFGYAQTTMNATDIYSAIQAKSLDGCEIQPSTAESYRLYEVTPYLALTKHYMLQSSFVCGKALLDGMPEEDRALFVKTVNDTVIKYSGVIASEEQGIYDSLRSKGMTVTEADLAPFQDAIAPLFTNNDLGLTPGLKETLFKQLDL